MLAPKSVRAAESAQTEEVRAAGATARQALDDKKMSDAEANAIISAYNQMPNAVKLILR